MDFPWQMDQGDSCGSLIKDIASVVVQGAVSHAGMLFGSQAIRLARGVAT